MESRDMTPNWTQEISRLAQATNTINTHLYDALLVGLNNAIAASDLPPLPLVTPDLILESLYELRIDFIDGPYEGIDETAVFVGIAEIVEQWCKLSFAEHENVVRLMP
jgi:hypothetical protein